MNIQELKTSLEKRLAEVSVLAKNNFQQWSKTGEQSYADDFHMYVGIKLELTNILYDI